MTSILVVDDEVDIVTMVADMLRSAGYETLQTTSTRTAIPMIHAHSIDLLLTDVRLGRDESGVALAVAARELRPGIAVVFMSGWADSIGDAGIRDGRFLVKPFRAEALLQTVANTLSAATQTWSSP